MSKTPTLPQTGGSFVVTGKGNPKREGKAPDDAGRSLQKTAQNTGQKPGEKEA